MQVIVVDDSALFRSGLVSLLDAAGVSVVQALADTKRLAEAVLLDRPDAVVLDIRMPPTFTDEGLGAAFEVKRMRPRTGVLILSTYAEPSWLRRLTDHVHTGVGYLLKDRVGDIDRLVDALDTVVAGGIAIDPVLVERALNERRPVLGLTERELEVLAGVAEGRSNSAIARTMGVSVRTVEAHISSILRTLGIEESPDAHRRVLAALAFVKAVPPVT